MKYFAAGLTAGTAAELAGVHRAVQLFVFSQATAPPLPRNNRKEPHSLLERLDESYSGDIRKGKQGRGIAGKVAVSGILKCGGSVYTQTTPDAKTDTLTPIIRQKITPCLY